MADVDWAQAALYQPCISGCHGLWLGDAGGGYAGGIIWLLSGVSADYSYP
jgi:hypothetical protein